MNPNTRPLRIMVSVALLVVVIGAANARDLVAGQNKQQPTPIQREIESQRRRLNASDIEERRDALMRLGNLKRPDA